MGATDRTGDNTCQNARGAIASQLLAAAFDELQTRLRGVMLPSSQSLMASSGSDH